MLKVYYRLVYWRRRLGRAVLRLGPVRRPSQYRAGARRWLPQMRPLLVFAVMVSIVLVVSAVLGWWSGGWYGTAVPYP